MHRTVVQAACLALAMLAPARSHAQQARVRPGAAIGPVPVPPLTARPQVGFGTLRRLDGENRDSHGSLRRPPRLSGFGLLRPGVAGAYFYGTSVMQMQSAAAPAAVPYAVPYYYPVPVPAVAAESPAPPVPYDPAKSRMLTISSGVDGGGGVMRIERVSDDTLRLTWRGSVRPIRDAQLFLADSLQRPFRSQAVNVSSPTASFLIRGLDAAIAYTGLTVVTANGATATTLVPYRHP